MKAVSRAGTEAMATVGVVVFLLAVWQTAVSTFHVPGWLLPAPTVIWDQSLGRAGLLGAQTATTALVAILGVVIGGVIGVSVAILMASSRLVEGAVLPLLLIDQSIPKVAIAPLFIIWFGSGLKSRVIIAVMIAFLPIVVNTLSGLAAIDPRIRDLMRTLAAGRLTLLAKIQLRNAVPFMFTGLKAAVPLAIIGAVVAEFLQSDSGLGYVMLIAVTQYNTPLIFACICLLALLSLVLFGAVSLVEAMVLRHRYRYVGLDRGRCVTGSCRCWHERCFDYLSRRQRTWQANIIDPAIGDPVRRDRRHPAGLAGAGAVVCHA